VRQIPPGGKGKIKVTVNTGGYGGTKIREVVRILTNDKQRPGLSVAVTGFVEKFVEINPPRVVLRGSQGEPVASRVTITQRMEYPFKILNTHAKIGRHFKFNVQELNSSGTSGYVLTVENTKKETGRYADTIYLKTDSKLRPTIPISVIGLILK